MTDYAIMMSVANDGELTINEAPDTTKIPLDSFAALAARGVLQVANDGTFYVATLLRTVQYRVAGVEFSPSGLQPPLLVFGKVYDGEKDPRDGHTDEFVPDVGIVRFEPGAHTGTLIDPLVTDVDLAAEQEAAAVAAQIAAEQGGQS